VPNWLMNRKDRPEKLPKGLINSISIRRVNHELTFGCWNPPCSVFAPQS
jgi:hypothetical protein